MSGRYIIGLLLILVGIVYLLEYLGAIPSGFLTLWWPVIIIVLGLNSLLRRPMRPWGPLILILIGVLLQLWLLKLLPANLWPAVLALLLILVGVRMLLPRRRYGPITTTNMKDRINDTISFGSLRYQNDSPQFAGGSIAASFSNYELDLRGAALAPTGADLELTVSFGGIEVRVPENWVIRVTGVPVFGSCTNRARRTIPETAGVPTLRILCNARFGSIEITN